jgi:cellulose biosynthesis protein BcsQ
MHIVTFYSYKGGVGRTMALVNAAAVLAQRGHKVLIVDFDLEAPGISTYKPFACLTDAKGVVEYVSEYIETAAAPNAEEFIVRSKLGEANIWAMPAGKRNREYPNRLASIDWQSLYSLQKGYLFFEDLKQQWRELKFDYVLIDSRTGHTDVGGICTRQLPNAVVIMFFPNDQNLVGLESVVKDIREEAQVSRRDEITLAFCASNVPDLDDEDHILERKLKDARRVLGYKSNPAVVHHYNSLSLLEQSLFVLDRPESKLAAEYTALVNLIISQNLEDPDGAIAVLRRMRDEIRKKAAGQDLDYPIPRKLAEIEDLHAGNGNVAWLLAQIYSLIGDLDAETRCLTTAIEANVNAHTARRRRAAIARLESRSEDAVADLLTLLADEHIPSFEFVAAVELLREFEPDWISVVAESRALNSLEAFQMMRLSDILMSDPKGVQLAIELLQRVVVSEKDVSNRRAARARLTLSLISSKQFERAMKAIADSRDEVLKSGIVQDVFNYAMAEWGSSGAPQQELMRRVLALAEGDDFRSVNWHQCFAIAHFVCGERDAAMASIEGARKLNERLRGREFSCWRYLAVSRNEMRRDLSALEQFVRGEGQGPAVFLADDPMLPFAN